MKEKSVPVRMNEDDIALLDSLAEVMQSNRSEIIRSMIPRQTIAQAITKHLQLKTNGMPTGSRVAKYITNFAVQSFLHTEMMNDPDHPIPLQMAFCEEPVEDLYIKWAAAKLGEDGFAFNEIVCDSITVFWVFDPRESENARRQKAEKIREYIKTNLQK